MKFSAFLLVVLVASLVAVTVHGGKSIPPGEYCGLAGGLNFHFAVDANQFVQEHIYEVAKPSQICRMTGPAGVVGSDIHLRVQMEGDCAFLATFVPPSRVTMSTSASGVTTMSMPYSFNGKSGTAIFNKSFCLTVPHGKYCSTSTAAASVAVAVVAHGAKAHVVFGLIGEPTLTCFFDTPRLIGTSSGFGMAMIDPSEGCGTLVLQTVKFAALKLTMSGAFRGKNFSVTFATCASTSAITGKFCAMSLPGLGLSIDFGVDPDSGISTFSEVFWGFKKPFPEANCVIGGYIIAIAGQMMSLPMEMSGGCSEFFTQVPFEFRAATIVSGIPRMNYRYPNQTTGYSVLSPTGCIRPVSGSYGGLHTGKAMALMLTVRDANFTFVMGKSTEVQAKCAVKGTFVAGNPGGLTGIASEVSCDANFDIVPEGLVYSNASKAFTMTIRDKSASNNFGTITVTMT